MKYTGIVIGGPKAGLEMTVEGDILSVAEYPSLKGWNPNSQFDPYDTYKIHVYKHVPWRLVENGNEMRWGFWVNIDDPAPLTEIMQTLIISYQANAGMRR